MKKRLFSLLLLIAICLGLVSCGEKSYPAVESSEEEKRVMFTFNIEGDSYEVKYELYRALFLNFKSSVDGGDGGVWSGADKDGYIQKIDARIKDYAADIYATLHLAKSLGFKPYSQSVEGKIQEYIKNSVEGNSTGSETLVGFGGDYDAYLASLREMNLNYSVQVLLFRYALARDYIDEYYFGTRDEDNPTPDMESGHLEYTDGDIEDFYLGEDSARFLLVTLDARSYTAERAGEIRDKIASYSNEAGVRNYARDFTATQDSDVTNGVIIGKYSEDAAYYKELTDAAFSLSVGETSEVIHISAGGVGQYLILYKVSKTRDYYDSNKAAVTEAYIANRIGEILLGVKGDAMADITDAALLSELNRAEVKMP